MRRPRSEAPSRDDVLAGRYDAEFLLGPYRRLLLAHARVEADRRRAASGGVLTRTLCALLQSGRADAVLAVGFAPDAPLAPRYLTLTTPEAVRAAAGSVYAYIPPRELTAALDAARAAGRRAAVVCQPCLAPLVRRRQAADPGAVVLVASFFCGWNMTLDATAHLVRKAGFDPADVAEVRYRHGDYPGGFMVRTRDGRERRFSKAAYELLNMQFLRPGCGRCACYMGDGADLACGDAWLRGRADLSAVLARTQAGLDALALAADGLECFALAEADLVRMHLGNLRYKKYGLSAPMRLLTWLFNSALPKNLPP
ncbi:MAG: Coenzyme F420 hydrogenase/dehydrogenase, beta subunit C-terminal domain, partial [Desulfovibrionaceae bacterium]